MSEALSKTVITMASGGALLALNSSQLLLRQALGASGGQRSKGGNSNAFFHISMLIEILLIRPTKI